MQWIESFWFFFVYFWLFVIENKKELSSFFPWPLVSKSKGVYPPNFKLLFVSIKSIIFPLLSQNLWKSETFEPSLDFLKIKLNFISKFGLIQSLINFHCLLSIIVDSGKIFFLFIRFFIFSFSFFNKFISFSCFSSFSFNLFCNSFILISFSLIKLFWLLILVSNSLIISS